jgi:hypothetical protein
MQRLHYFNGQQKGQSPFYFLLASASSEAFYIICPAFTCGGAQRAGIAILLRANQVHSGGDVECTLIVTRRRSIYLCARIYTLRCGDVLCDLIFVRRRKPSGKQRRAYILYKYAARAERCCWRRWITSFLAASSAEPTQRTARAARRHQSATPHAAAYFAFLTLRAANFYWASAHRTTGDWESRFLSASLQHASPPSNENF